MTMLKTLIKKNKYFVEKCLKRDYTKLEIALFAGVIGLIYGIINALIIYIKYIY